MLAPLNKRIHFKLRESRPSRKMTMKGLYCTVAAQPVSTIFGLAVPRLEHAVRARKAPQRPLQTRPVPKCRRVHQRQSHDVLKIGVLEGDADTGSRVGDCRGKPWLQHKCAC